MTVYSTAESIRNSNPEWTSSAFLNRHVHNYELADHKRRTVTTPNNDTLYSSAVLELSATPVELILPEVGERYLSVALMDVFTDQFAHIGPRETGGKRGAYWIVGPDDNTGAPEGVTKIRATGNDVWLLARTFVSGQSDLAAARTAQQGIVVRPVFPDKSPKPFETLVTEVSDSRNFLNVVNEALTRNPTHPQSKRAANYSAIGLGPNSALGPIERLYWSVVTPKAEAAIAGQVNERLSENVGWSDPPHNIGYYGEDDATRSAIALIGFGALRRKDAIYYRMTRTEDGALLDGAKNYQMIIPENVPAQAFWSISLYEPDNTGRYFFYETATGRHSLNSASKELTRRDDGSILLHLSSKPPSGETTNWMPTPDGPFAAFFRVYLPDEQAIKNGWAPPPIVQK